jgi:hypothetical protein
VYYPCASLLDLDRNAVLCYEFPVVEAAVQYAEACFTSLAIGCGVLDKPSARITLRELLQRHALEVC